MRDSALPAAETIAQDASTPQATLVICTRNRPTLLRKCLEGIQNLLQQPKEVIVVDNSEGDEATLAVADQFGARYVLAAPPGLSRARNRGIQEAKTDVVAFLDDDAIPSPDWLTHMLAVFQDAEIGAASGHIVTPDKEDALSSSAIPRSLNNRNPQWLEISSFGGMGLGGNMALRRSACVGRDVFDERLGRGAPFQIAEEHFAFAYLISLGYTVRYIPEAIVFHPPLRSDSLATEARNSFAYFLLLLREFPSERVKMIEFLLRRLQGKPLTWARDGQEPGKLVTSGWGTKLNAVINGAWLFLKTPRKRNP